MTQAPARRGKTIALRILAVVVVAVIGLFAYVRLALAPKVYDVVSIKTEPTYREPSLLTRAWSLPVAATYGPRALQFQPRASYCGPTSLANVTASFGDDASATPSSILKDTGYCWSGQCLPGLTLDELAEIARAKLGRSVTVLRDLSLAQFREHMTRSNDPGRRYVINFLRGPLFRQGGGHHSPIGGYLEDEDLVFVLDVNEDYQPWLVSSARLLEAMNTTDGSTDLSRGLLLIE